MKWFPFGEVIKDVTSKFRKIKKSEYKTEGPYKIVDQGKEPIAGYTDNAELINFNLKPTIIFGDHTRIFKYEDSPIALGADGVKALRVNPSLADPRYVYYYLNSIQLEDAGYSRHFKFLKEKKIPIPLEGDDPDIDAQIRIAHLLGKVEGLIVRRKENIKQLDDLLKNIFLGMFGDPVRNDKGWRVEPCEKVVTGIKSGTSYGGIGKDTLEDDEYGVLKISSVTKGSFDSNEFKAVKKSAINKTLVFVQKGDFLISRANTIELVAACCIVGEDYPDLFIPDKLWLLSFSNFIEPQYFNFLMKNQNYRNQVRKKASGGHDSMLNISMKKFRSLSVPVPPPELQNQFAAIVEKVEGIKSLYKRSLTELDNLYGALSQKAFKGELDLSRVPLEQKEAQPIRGIMSVRAEVSQIPEYAEPQVEDEIAELSLPTDYPMNTTEGRESLLRQWFDELIQGQKNNGELTFDNFWQTVQMRAIDYMGEEDLPFTLKDYDTFKGWVYAALEQGTIQQKFNEDENKIVLEAIG